MKYNNELEYSNKLTNLIRLEKDNLEHLNEKFVTTEEKIESIIYSKKCLIENQEEAKKKTKNFKFVAKTMEEELLNLDVLMKYQQDELEKLTGSFEEMKQT